MDILKNSLGYDVVEICFHVLEENIDVFVVVSPDGLIEFYDVGVLQLF